MVIGQPDAGNLLHINKLYLNINNNNNNKKKKNPHLIISKKEWYYGYEFWHTKIRTWDNCHRDIGACNICSGDNCPHVELSNSRLRYQTRS